MTGMRVGVGAHGVGGTGDRTWTFRSARAAIAAVWQRHGDLLSNTGSLLATTGVTSALGFAYWIVAARMFSQSAVGYGSAAVSAMTLLGTIGMLGLNTLLIGELPRRTRPGRPGVGCADHQRARLFGAGTGFRGGGSPRQHPFRQHGRRAWTGRQYLRPAWP